MCRPSPVASRCWLDVDAAYPGELTFLGIVGDSAHAVHVSGHNCGRLQESPIDGVDYADDFAHALDIGHGVGRGGDRVLAAKIRGQLLTDTRVRYVIDNGVGYYPPHRGGGTFDSFDHKDHLHVSFMPGTTFDVRPFDFDNGGLMPGDVDRIIEDNKRTRALIVSGTSKVLRSEQRTRSRLIKAGVIPADPADESEIQKDLDEIKAQGAD